MTEQEESDLVGYVRGDYAPAQPAIPRAADDWDEHLRQLGVLLQGPEPGSY